MPTINNQKFYQAALKKYGHTAQGLHWNSSLYQTLRFDQIIKLLPKDLQNFTLTDVGCGFGDLYNYLEQKPKHYTGIDVMEEMVTVARENTEQKILQLNLTKNTPEPSDYIVCSGALNILTRFETTQFLQNCYKASKKGFIFNCLYGDKESATYNYLDYHFLAKTAKSLGVNEVKYIHDYIPGDITVGFFR